MIVYTLYINIIFVYPNVYVAIKPLYFMKWFLARESSYFVGIEKQQCFTFQI